MTPYHAQHADLFSAVAEILVREYIAPSVTEETVAEWCESVIYGNKVIPRRHAQRGLYVMEPSELAALIADVEGYERRQG